MHFDNVLNFNSSRDNCPSGRLTDRSGEVDTLTVPCWRVPGSGRGWQDFYSKLKDEDKALLPLVPIYFYAPPS